MNFGKGYSFALLVLCLFSITACKTEVQTTENQEEQASATIHANTAPTLESDQDNDLLPAGVLVSSNDDSSLRIYNNEGQEMTEINTPGIGSVDPEHVHLAGPANGENFAIPVLYHSWEPEQALMVNDQDGIRTLRRTESFLALSGTPGQSALAFSEVLIENNAPHSYLYTGNLDDMGTIVPFYDLADEKTRMALSPVGVKAVDGNPQGVWYTKTGWGIGGVDLIFPITRGLYYYDLISEKNLQYIDPERSIQGISPDYSLAGSIAFDFEDDRSMTILDLENNETTNFPLKSSSDRGAGFVVFSPDNQFAAWLEGSGSFMDNPESFQAVIRVGDLKSGNVVIEVKDSIISRNLDGNPISFIKPAGWLDNQSLLFEVRGEDWGDVSLMRLDLIDRTISHFCEGSFVGFAYP